MSDNQNGNAESTGEEKGLLARGVDAVKDAMFGDGDPDAEALEPETPDSEDAEAEESEPEVAEPKPEKVKPVEFWRVFCSNPNRSVIGGLKIEAKPVTYTCACRMKLTIEETGMIDEYHEVKQITV